MKKRISLICGILAMSVLFAACSILAQTRPSETTATTDSNGTLSEHNWSPNPNDCPNIAPELAIRMRKAYWQFIGGSLDEFPIYCEWTSTYHTPDIVLVQRYFGNIGGMEIAFMHAGMAYPDVIREVDIAGYEFVFSSGQELYAYKNGHFYSILQAYETDLLTRQDVGTIWNLFNTRLNWHSNPNDCPNVDPELALHLRKAYWRFHGGNIFDFPIRTEWELLGEHRVTYTTSDIVVVASYIGTIAGMPIVIMDRGQVHQMAHRYFDVAGYQFMLGTLDTEIYAHRNGNFYAIEDAYNSGILTAADVGVIWNLMYRQ